MNLQTFTDPQNFIRTSLDFILGLDPETIALSGGSTPGPIYSELGRITEGENKRFYQVDERYVNREDPESNYRLIQSTLFNNQDPKNFHYFNTELSIPEALDKYEEQIPEDDFDLIILGIGPDGHTASLFPNSPALEAIRLVASAETDQFPVKDRLTITFTTIMRSMNILVLLKNKPEVLAELQNPTKTFRQFPALRLLEHANLNIYSLNEAKLDPEGPAH